LKSSKHGKLNIVAGFVICLLGFCGDSTIKHKHKKRYCFFGKTRKGRGIMYLGLAAALAAWYNRTVKENSRYLVLKGRADEEVFS